MQQQQQEILAIMKQNRQLISMLQELGVRLPSSSNPIEF